MNIELHGVIVYSMILPALHCQQVSFPSRLLYTITAGKVIVHDWAHLRWGLFNEYPDYTDDNDQHFYEDDAKKIQASRCNLNIKGMTFDRVTYRDCVVDRTTGLYERSCRFAPNTKSINDVKVASMMSYQFIDQVRIWIHMKRHKRI